MLPARSGDQAKEAAAAGGMTPKSRGLLKGADQDDPIVQQFQKADLNHDGKLSQYEIKEMMITQLGYDADEAYVASLLKMFGDYDLDSDGAISLDEFEPLFNHLGGMERAKLVASQGAVEDQAKAERVADPVTITCLDKGPFGVSFEDKGNALVVDYITPGGMVARLSDRVKPGMTLTSIQGRKLKSTKDALKRLKSTKRPVTLGFDEVDSSTDSSSTSDSTNATPTDAASIESTASSRFASFDSKQQGWLAPEDVQSVLTALAYDHDEAYVKDLMETFAQFDEDGDGKLQENEFQHLWDHLGGDQRFEEAELERAHKGQAESLPEAPTTADMPSEGLPPEDSATSHGSSVRDMFARYASSKETVDAADVTQMLGDLGYDGDASHAKDLVTRFGQKDAIDLDGFVQLLAHLGVDPSGPDKAKSSAVPSQHYLSKIYQGFDVNGGGLRCEFLSYYPLWFESS
eukprot:COSAG02_NODE_3251_length_7094_cov_3.932094_2_plen_461_part_00